MRMAAPLWTAEEFLVAVRGRLVGGDPGDVTSISIDSRTVSNGAAFFAIKGENFDGHDFAVAALDAGAAVSVVAKAQVPGGHVGPFVAVDDPLRALERLGIAARARSTAKIIGVTGSVGKTSTKEALRMGLGACGETFASPSSFNNHWGVPLSLASLRASAAFGVFEMGMNHLGEITPLAQMVRPHVAIITTVAPVHIGFFSSIAEIAEAKAEIFSGLEPGGIAVLPFDNDHIEFLKERAMAAGAGIVTFGDDRSADAALVSFQDRGPGSQVAADICGRRLTFTLGSPGRHLAINSLAVLAAVHAAGGDVKTAAAALGALSAPAGRGARTVLEVEGGTALLIDESYNANPVSMAAALAMLGASEPQKGGRRIAVLGDMLELGENTAHYHRKLAPMVARARADIALLSGPHMAELVKELPNSICISHAKTAAENEAKLLEEVRCGDVVMVKGSLGSRLGPLVEALKRRYAATSKPPKG